jgi:translation initiation factor IF-3
MIVTIKNDDGEFLFDINKIDDEAKRQEAGVIVQKVGNLSVVIEALDFASRTHRANLEQLLMECDEAKVEQTDEESETTEPSSDDS